MSIPREFIVNLKGKEFVMFAGLLNLGHQNGLIAIENEILPDLSQPDKDIWVVRSTGRFKSDIGEAIWCAHGDAGPGNSQMKGAYLRHAETRAAARMLRLATNVGMTALEELGPDYEGDERKAGASRPAANGQPQSTAPAHRNPASANQRGAATGAAGGVVGDQSPAPVCTVDGCGTILTERELNGCLQAGWELMCMDHAREYKAGLKLLAQKAAEAT